MNKELVTQAFERLGPERVDIGLRSHTPGSGWNNCFLAAATGFHTGHEMHCMVGLSDEQVCQIVSNYDHGALREAFLNLAREWLEQNRNPRPQPQLQEAV